MLDRSQFRQAVIRLAAYCREVVQQGPDHPHFRGGKPEENTKNKIIDPLFDTLGFTQPDFRTLETGIARGWVDYSLKTDPDAPPIMLVEAKPIFEDHLWDRYRQQIYQYIQDYRMSAFGEDFVRWIVLTNGYELHILRLNDRNPHWSFQVQEATADLLYELLNRESVRDGIIDAKYLEEHKQGLDKTFLEDLKRWRLILANGFYARNTSLSLEDLTLASQTYLNRLMFIRILETYQLRPTGWLAKLYRQWKDAGWSSAVHPFGVEIIRAFQDTEFRFNTELFKEGLCDELQIDDTFIEAVIVQEKPISDTVLEKVAPAGVDLWSHTIYNYDFTELSVDVLGSVYERFLAHEFALQNGRVVIRGADEPTEARKLRRKEGIYYTPTWVTKFIVRQCLEERLRSILDTAIRALGQDEPQVAYSTIIGAAGIRVADIAMGSGSFLLHAYELFFDTYEKYNAAVTRKRDNLAEARHRPDLLEVMSYALIPDPATLALTSVYGVDIDPQAIEVAKLNFWLRLLAKNADKFRRMERAHHVLPRLDLHFRQGNSIITASRHPRFPEIMESRKDGLAEVNRQYKVALENPTEENILAFQSLSTGISFEISRELLDDYFNGRTAAKSPLVLEVAFPELFLVSDGTLTAAGGFDAIVGNPPYEVLSYKERGISPEEEREEKKFLDDTYGTRFQKYNLYRFFFERGLDLVKPGGTFGFIVPLTLLADESSYKLRYKLLAETTIKGLYCFPERARVFEDVTQAVCIAILRRDRGYQGPASEDGWKTAIDDDSNVSIAYGLMNGADLEEAECLTIPVRRLRALHPRFMPVPLISEQGWATLEVIARFQHLGVWEDRGLISVKQREINLNEDSELYGNRETSYRLVRGEHVAPFELRLDITTPEYVDREAFLRKKGGGRFRSGADHEQTRIGIQEVANLALVDRLKCTIIPPGMFVGHTVDYIVPKGPGVDLYYLVGVLNSDVLDWRFRITSTNNHVTTNQLRALPIPTGEEAPEIAQLMREISSVTRELVELSSLLHSIRTEFVGHFGLHAPLPSTLASYLNTPGITHRVLSQDPNRPGIVVQVFLTVVDQEVVISAAVARGEDFRTGQKTIEPILAFTSSDSLLVDFLCLALDREIAVHGDAKWTPGNGLAPVLATLIRSIPLPIFAATLEENSVIIRETMAKLNHFDPSPSQALERRDTLKRRHAELTKTLFGVDDLPAFEQGEEDEVGNEDSD